MKESFSVTKPVNDSAAATYVPTEASKYEWNPLPACCREYRREVDGAELPE